MAITSKIIKLLHAAIPQPLAGFVRDSDRASKLDVCVSEVVDFLIKDYFGEVALGNIEGRMSMDKFGAAPFGVQTTETDIWDRADAVPTQPVWLAPTAARIHTIQSTSAQDIVGGTGVATVDISYLPDWNTEEAIERVTGNLNAGIAMSNAAVIIHRMVVLPQASTTDPGGNEGTITATAAVDATVTAAILPGAGSEPGNGETEMAIYGIPSTQKALLYNWDAQIDKSQGAVASINFRLRVNLNPDVQTVSFHRRDDISVQSTGTSSRAKPKLPPILIEGPAIIKVTGEGSVNDLDAEAGFDLVIVDN
ncbi:MAG: hypothetical protein QGM50_02410 [Anaerolineae bacterium]|nr:hypothetical protein [Anaerolineae bacterium]MDK1117623.1 hypothetical protein [Anaerolineae bacterium]